MDPTDILTGTLNNLSLFNLPTSNNPQEQTTPSPGLNLQSFPLYQRLPSELRLKILSHTLPPPSLLRVKAHVLISDPSFGLYLTFSISPTGYKPNTPDGAFQPKPEHGQITTALQHARMIPLLSACKETREFYLSKYTIPLPSNSKGEGRGKGQIRISPLETLYIDNFPSLLSDVDFSTAITSMPQYRVQTFWTRLERVAVPVTCLTMTVHACSTVMLRTVRRLEGVRVLSGVLWDGFGDRCVERGDVEGLVGDMDRVLQVSRGKMVEGLRELEGEDEGEREGDGGRGYEMPKMEILEV
ncbi:hypothetical protein ACEPPN_018702 [Leptodophora sp. 'Broadleaf-Isolate-01']